jgi:NAD(P)H-dependent flavin oxidoreductase YrpB (nitropropane dioxygenase family)
VKSVIGKRLDLEFPIFGFSHCRDVVVEVSKSGGLGVLGIGRMSPEAVDQELRAVTTSLRGRPFGVDFAATAETRADRTQREQKERASAESAESFGLAQRALVTRLMDEFDIPPSPKMIPDAAEVMYNNRCLEGGLALLDVAMSYGAKVVVNAMGLVPHPVLDRAHEAGLLVGAMVGTARHAVKQRDAGVDFVVAQGWEAAGHSGPIASMVLVPEVVDTVRPLPVIAAGGIGTGRQAAAAEALGADGVWCGSLWLGSLESETHPAVAEKLWAASSSDFVRSRSFDGYDQRVLRSPWTDEWEGDVAPLVGHHQAELVSGALERIDHAAHVSPGARALITESAGQVVSLLKGPRSCSQIIADLIDEYISTVEHMAANMPSA